MAEDIRRPIKINEKRKPGRPRMDGGIRKPIKINEEAYRFLAEEKYRLRAKSISETILKLGEEKKDPDREELIKALDKARELVVGTPK